MNDKLLALAKKLEQTYEFENVIRNEEFYKLIVKHEAENFLVTSNDIDDNWIYFKKVHRMIHTGLHPADIRNLNSDYDF